jgi:hypothetical protein
MLSAIQTSSAFSSSRHVCWSIAQAYRAQGTQWETEEHTAGLLKRVFAAGFENRVAFSSFTHTNMSRIHATDPRFDICLLFNGETSDRIPSDFVAQAKLHSASQACVCLLLLPVCSWSQADPCPRVRSDRCFCARGSRCWTACHGVVPRPRARQCGGPAAPSIPGGRLHLHQSARSPQLGLTCRASLHAGHVLQLLVGSSSE